MAKTSCPPVGALQKLATGDLPSPEMEPVLEHLESCETCFDKVRTLSSSGTLMDALAKAKTPPAGPDEELVSRLIDRLQKLGGPAPGPKAAANIVSFQCAGCGKGLKTKAELAGKKVKCPQCGQAVAVSKPEVGDEKSGVKTQRPEVAGQKPEGGEMRTLPPKDPGRQEQDFEGRTLAPKEVAEPQHFAPTASAGQTHSAPSDAHESDEEEPWDFLAPPQTPDEIGRLGPYRVLKVLGAGGMGVVFRAEDPQLKRLVALKAMLPSIAGSGSAKKRFLREAQAAAAIKHNHIVTIFQVGEDRGAPFLAMEFLEGEPLDDCLKREKKLPVPEILRIGRQIAEGLQAAHEKKLIHRDIKPANIWLEGKEERGMMNDERKNSGARSSFLTPHSSFRCVKILDFGLARAVGDTTHLTQSGAIVGTPAYMAPEQAGGKPVDHRCDLFSLGCVLYRMSTGEMPFKGNDTISIISALALDNPPPPVSLNLELPTELSDLIMQLLAKDPKDRPQSARAVAETLREIETDTLSGKPQATKKSRPTKSTARIVGRPHSKLNTQNSKLIVLGSSVVLVAAIIAGLVIFWQTPHGTVKIESDDPTIEITFDKTGPTIKGAGKEPITLRAGEHGILVKRGDFELITDKLVIKKGELTTLKIQLIGAKMQLMQDGKEIAAKDTTFTNSLGMEFVLVPKGKSSLGGGGGKSGDKEVEITDDFYLGKYEVTQEEWQKVTGKNPSGFSRGGAVGERAKDVADADLARFPVESVSWDDCQLFIDSLNKQAKDAGWVYRLPKEAEWEYACRGGPMKEKDEGAFDFYFEKPSTALRPDQANFAFRLPRTSKVGSYQPNKLGLYDIHGNVWEWCDDVAKPDPKDATGTSRRITCGGGWGNFENLCRAMDRITYRPSERYDYLGLRIARVPVGKEIVKIIAPEEKKTPVGTESTSPNKNAGWVQLFNGRDLAGLKTYPQGAPHHWTVENGVLNYRAEKDAKGVLLVSERGDYGDVHVRLECKTVRGIGSLIVRAATSDPARSGYHAKITHAAPKSRTGSLIVAGAPTTRGVLVTDQLVPPNTWFTLDVIVQGYRCTVKVNGKVTAEHEDEAKLWKQGHIALIPAGLFPPDFSFRTIEVRELAAGSSPLTFTNALGMEFVLVPKGKSWLGGGGGKPGDKEVEIKEDFYLGKYEVTQEEWEKVTGRNPSEFKAVAGISKEDQKRFPVEQVSWDDCQAFIDRINKQAKEAGWVYRLPTELEWEYACRGGPMTGKAESAFDFYFEKPSQELFPDRANFTRSKGLRFFRDRARKKWPLRGSS